MLDKERVDEYIDGLMKNYFFNLFCLGGQYGAEETPNDYDSSSDEENNVYQLFICAISVFFFVKLVNTIQNKRMQ